MKMKPLVALAFAPMFLLAETNLVDTAKEEDGRSFLVAPLVTANPAFGNGGGVVGMHFFKTDPSDTVSPASAITGVGMYSDTDSYFAGLFARSYLKQDTWRIAGGYANGRINNAFDIPTLGQTVEFSTYINALFTRIDRRVKGNYFMGVTGAIVDVRYREGNEISKIYFEKFNVKDNLSGQLGIVGTHDSRDDVRYPEHGNHSEASLTTVPEWLGSETGYQVAELFGNQFLSLFDRQVLALRAYGRFTPAGTPYSGLSTLGRQSDLRGYTSGENVAENLIAFQGEYRWMFTKRLGAVGFVGISELYNGSMKNMNSDTFFPSAGLGLRFMLNTENKMNFRFDYAWGTDDEDGFYVGVGEAF
jgi:hypothetical protein